MAINNDDLVTKFYDNVRRGDIAAATAVFADDLTWVEPPFPGHEGARSTARPTSSPMSSGRSSPRGRT